MSNGVYGLKLNSWHEPGGESGGVFGGESGGIRLHDWTRFGQLILYQVLFLDNESGISVAARSDQAEDGIKV